MKKNDNNSSEEIYDHFVENKVPRYHGYSKVINDFLETPFRDSTLTLKVKELIALAVHASPSTINRPGIANHISRARLAGATDLEIEEVLAMVSLLGVHTFHIGLPTLLKELQASGREQEAKLPELGIRAKKLKKDFISKRGYWTDQRDLMASMVPEFFEAYMDLSNEPWRIGTIDEKVRELIYIAIDSSITHMYQFGLRIHIKNALHYGATPNEILEVFEIAATLGVSSYYSGMGIVNENLDL